MNYLLKPEEQECVKLVAYLEKLKKDGQIAVFTHTANETYTKSWKQKNRNKAMGVRPGIPDYIIVTKTYVLFIEMKREKGGVVSIDQKKWISSLNEKVSQAVVCRGFEQAKKVIGDYIEIEERINQLKPAGDIPKFMLSEPVQSILEEDL